MPKSTKNQGADDALDAILFAMSFSRLCLPLHSLRDKHNFRICCGEMPTSSALIDALYPGEEDDRPCAGFSGEDLWFAITNEGLRIAISYGVNKQKADDESRASVGKLVADAYKSAGFEVEWSGNPKNYIFASLKVSPEESL